MTTFQLATPLPPVGRDRFADARAEERANAPGGFLSSVGDAINSEWSAGWVGRFVSRMGMADDPDWRLDRETFDQLMEGLPEDMAEDFADTRSLAHAEKIRESLLGVAAARSRLEQRGWTGTGMRMLAAMTDPADILAGAAASAAFGPEAGVAVGAARKVGRIGRMMRAGMIGVAGNLPNQFILSDLDPQQDWRDVLYTAAGGFIGGNLGGAFNAPPRTKLASAARAAGIGSVTGASVATGAGIVQGDLDLGSIATAAVFGGTGGGVFGIVGARGSQTLDQRLADAMHRQATSIEFRDVLDGAMGAASSRELRSKTLRELVEEGVLTDKGKVAFRQDLDPTERARAVERLVSTSGLDPELDAAAISRLRSMDPDSVLAEFHNRMALDGTIVQGNVTAIAADRLSFGARYGVVEVGDLIPSHNPRVRSSQGGFAINPGSLPNERKYEIESLSVDSRRTVLEIGKNPNPARVFSDTQVAVDGPPIINPQRQVLGGNGRTMGLHLAYADAGHAATLKAAAVEAAAKFGIPREHVEALDNPVIVRILDSDVLDAHSTAFLSKAFNEGTGAGRSAVALASSAANTIDDSTIASIARALSQDDEASILTVLNDPRLSLDIVNRLQSAGAWSRSEVALYWDDTAGRLTNNGKQVIQSIILARMVGDTSTLIDLPPSIGSKLLASLPDILRANSSEGEARGLQSLLRTALDNYGEWKKQDEDRRETVVDRLFDQTYLMGEPPGYRNLSVASLMHGIIHMGHRKFAAAIRRIVDEATGGEGLLGGDGQAVPLRRAIYEAMGTDLKGPAVEALLSRLDEPEDIPTPKAGTAAEEAPAATSPIKGPTLVAASPDIRRAGQGADGPPSDFEIRVVGLLEQQPNLSIAEARIQVIRDMADEFGRVDDEQSGSPGRPTRRGGPMDQPPPPDSPPPPREPKRPGDFDLSFISSAKAGMAAVRRSFSSILGTSDADIVRRATTGYADDALLKTDGTGQRVSASTWVDRATRAHLAPFQREFDAAFSEWVKKRGIRLWQRSAERKRFDDMASMAILQPDLYTDPTIVRVANAVRHTLRETLLTAKRHGANGFDHIEPRDDYFPRILRHLALNQATRIHGDDAVHRLIERALADGGAFEPEDIPAIARAYIKTWRDLDRWVDSDKAALHDGRPDILREVLAGEGWSAEKLDNVIGSVFTERDSQAGVTARAKRRTILDETAEVETPAGTLRFSELLDRNVERVVPTYVRQVLGAAAAAEVYRAVGGEDVRTWSQLRGRMGRQMNGIRIDAETIERDLKMMETLDRHVRGLPLESHNIASRTMARLRGYNYIRLSGQFGFAQLPEAVAMVGETGFRTMLAQLPALRQVFSTAADGKLANPLLRTIEQVWGLGTDRLLHRFHDRLDDLEGSFDRTVARGDEWLFRAKRLAGDVSGMAAINMASQRMAAAGAIQKWHDDAKSNRIPSTRRLASMGMSEADARRVIKAMREEIDAQRGVRTVTGPLLGRRVEDIDFSKWTDQNAAAILVDAVDKWAKRVIQTNDIGNMHPWMVKDWGRLITQFRSFTLVAWEKQLLHRVQMRDWEAFASASLGMLGAGLVYMGQTYTQSIGLPEEERKRFLKDRLSTGSIAAASFQRGAFSSLLPAFIDQVLPIAGEDPIFNFRQTGLSTPLFSLDSSPSIQLVTKDPWRALRGLTSAVRDDRVVDRNDVMAAANLLPFQQVIGIRNMLRAFAARFPENDR